MFRVRIFHLLWIVDISSAFDRDNCPHCSTEQAYSEFLKPPVEDIDGPHTETHVLWSTHVEVIPITSDIGGWEPPSFHQELAKEATRGWRRFRWRRFLSQSQVGTLNDDFFHWQARLFEAEGNLDPTPPPDANSSWPGMSALPEYKRLRKIVEQFSRRYLARSGMHPKVAAGLNYSLFNWCAVHGPGEFHGPHTHVGAAYHVGVFYAQAGNAAGKLRFGDPRGHSPPFGRTFFHTPRSGDLIFFPSWLSHMATVTAPSSVIMNKEKEPYRVAFSFNLGSVAARLPWHLWWSDPTGDMRFSRRSKVDLKELGL